MAESSRSRRKPKIEPISYEELVGAAGMSGFGALHEVRPEDRAKLTHLLPQEVMPSEGKSPAEGELPTGGETPPEGETPAEGYRPTEGVLPAVRISPPEGELPTGGNTPTEGDMRAGGEVPSGGEPHPGYEAPTGGESPTGGNRRIYPARTAEDGHSLGEQALYSALWNAAEPQPDGSRIICIGWRGMSQIARLDPKNAKLNTRSLIEKLTLECIGREDSETRTGRTYRVFSPAQILDRRRQAGLEWVVRNRGVRFVPRPPGR